MINKGLFSSNSNEWATPSDFYKELDAEFHFNLDPCCTDENAKCERHFTKEQNGLLQDWGGGKSVLQSSVWQRVAEMGGEMLQRIAQAEYSRGYAHPCSHGYELFPPMDIPQGGDSVYQGEITFQ